MSEKDKTIAKIREIIDTKINPALSEHMGGLEFRSYEDGVLSVRFTGACRGCYAADDTLNGIVRQVFAQEMPEIRDVELDESIDPEMLDLARKLMKEGAGRK